METVNNQDMLIIEQTTNYQNTSIIDPQTSQQTPRPKRQHT